MLCLLFSNNFPFFVYSFIVKCCPRLEILELDHMCEITEADALKLCGSGLQRVETLEFTFTPVTPKALLHFARKFTGPLFLLICLGV